MTFALSTNWCNRRIESGRAIAELAKSLGFGALELGFHTTARQAKEIVECGVLPVGSVHAFCPVPISAPQGYPELYQLASFDAEARAMAQLQIRRNLEFTASVGADALVLHAGRVSGLGLFGRFSEKRRTKRGERLVGIFKRELESLVPELERLKVRLGLENLPTADGFPNAAEMREVVGEWVRPWFDTGHWFAMGGKAEEIPENPLGVHLNDSLGGDDHLPPGKGKIDFSLLRGALDSASHVVLEPNSGVSEADILVSESFNMEFLHFF